MNTKSPVAVRALSGFFQKEYSLHQATFLILFACGFWSVSTFFRKTIAMDVHPVLMAFAVAFGVTIPLLVLYRKQLPILGAAIRRDFFLFLMLGISGTLGTAAFYFGLQYIDLSIAIILEKLNPIFVIIMARFLLGEKLAAWKYPLIPVVLGCSYFIASPNAMSFSFSPAEILGFVAVIMAAFFWALATVLGKLLLNDHIEPGLLTLGRFGIASIILLPIFLLKAPLNLPMTMSWPVVTIAFGASIFMTAPGYLLYYKGMQKTSASVTGLTEMFYPVFTIALGIGLLGETLQMSQWLAIVPFTVALLVVMHK